MKFLSNEIHDIVPKISIVFNELPYIMGVFKQHNFFYRWLINAHDSIFSIIAQFICAASMALSLVMKER
jgi:hypothetical protein